MLEDLARHHDGGYTHAMTRVRTTVFYAVVGAVWLGACGARDDLDFAVDDGFDQDVQGSTAVTGGMGGATGQQGPQAVTDSGAGGAMVDSVSVGPGPNTAVGTTTGGPMSTVGPGATVGPGVGPGPTTATSTASGGPGACIACVAQQCPDAVTCLTDPQCAQSVACAAQNCLSGGNPDFVCVVGCFNGDIQAALEAAQGMLCVSSTCGAECGL